jgi:hypothetical protein
VAKKPKAKCCKKYFEKKQSVDQTYGKTDAMADRKRSLPANTEAAWVGYAMVIYIKMLWKVRKIPGKYRAAPMTGEIQ